MAIKNYTTTVTSEKTIGEIEALLARKGASKIMKEYDPTGEVSALCFMLRMGDSELPFSLPMREESIYKLLEQQCKKGSIRRSFVTRAQAKRIGWRILKDWVDAQLALVEIGMAQMDEVFMPYLYSAQRRQTLYEISAGRKFQNLLPAVTE